ncbi:MAG: hypothetical protein AVDCRST_MAG76-3092, partial [uncultured Acidimicrobiales bacterium]
AAHRAGCRRRPAPGQRHGGDPGRAGGGGDRRPQRPPLPGGVGGARARPRDLAVRAPGRCGGRPRPRASPLHPGPPGASRSRPSALVGSHHAPRRDPRRPHHHLTGRHPGGEGRRRLRGRGAERPGGAEARPGVGRPGPSPRRRL